MAEWEEELKSLLMKVKEESEKARLKLNIPETKMRGRGAVPGQAPQGREPWAARGVQEAGGR